MLAVFDGPLEYFGFVNFTGTSKDTDLGTYFTEQTLRWKFAKNLPFNIASQLVFRDGNRNDSYRLGIRWMANQTSGLTELLEKIHLNYAVTAYTLEANYWNNHWLTQIEDAYRLSFLKNKIYLSGFADQNITYSQEKPFTWVTEHQLGIQLANNFYGVAEYRINEYRSETTGVGLGLEYVMRF